MKRGCGCLVAFPILVFGLVFTAIGGGWLYSSVQRVNRSTETTGVIVDLNPDFDSDGTTYAPVIEFVAADGKTYRFASNFYRSPSPTVGAPIGVLYDPDNPSDASENSKGLLWVFPGIFLIVGLFVLALGIWIAGKRGPTRALDPLLKPGTSKVVVLGGPSSEEDVSVPADTQEDSTESFMTQFRRVEPQGPDTEGKFRYRVVARDDAGALYFSDWLEEDPTTALITSGVHEVRVAWRDDHFEVVDIPQ